MKFYNFTKRLLDIIGSIVGIIIFSPLLIMGTIWVKLVSPKGPILADIPDRVGLNRKPFKLYKFRSMVPNAHELMLNDPELRKLHRENGYKLDPDPRLLPGAKFLRKSSIDEMPQFFNILFGDMSLVGPRAYYFHELAEQLEVNPEAKEYIDLALSVKPGLTGIWQVSGRSEISFKNRVKMDAEYAKRKSILYDLLIILKTPFAIISGKGAF